MLNTPVHKDIKEYRPKIAFGLSFRMIASIGGAIGTAVLVGFYCVYVLGISDEYLTVIVTFLSVPFWCIGFLRPKGMPFEVYFPLFLRHKMGHNKIAYVSSAQKLLENERADKQPENTLNKTSKKYLKLRALKAIERWEPTHE